MSSIFENDGEEQRIALVEEEVMAMEKALDMPLHGAKKKKLMNSILEIVKIYLRSLKDGDYEDNDEYYDSQLRFFWYLNGLID